MGSNTRENEVFCFSIKHADCSIGGRLFSLLAYLPFNGSLERKRVKKKTSVLLRGLWSAIRVFYLVLYHRPYWGTLLFITACFDWYCLVYLVLTLDQWPGEVAGNCPRKLDPQSPWKHQVICVAPTEIVRAKVALYFILNISLFRSCRGAPVRI